MGFEGQPGGAAATKRYALAEELRAHLTEAPRSRADLARAVSRGPNDGQVLRALDVLGQEGFAHKSDRGWSIVSHPVDPQGNGWMDEGAARLVGEAA